MEIDTDLIVGVSQDGAKENNSASHIATTGMPAGKSTKSLTCDASASQDGSPASWQVLCPS